MKIMRYDKILRTKWTDSDTSGETLPQTQRLREFGRPALQKVDKYQKERIINENKR